MAAVIEERGDVGVLLKYEGPAVDDGSMDLYEVAANMVAFSDYVIIAAHATFGPETKVQADVTAFSRGSFETDLLFHVIGLGSAIFAAHPDLASLTKVLKESLNLYKFLRGEKPAKVEHKDDHSVHVTNTNGDVAVVNIASMTVVLDPRAGANAETFVAKALAREGVTGVTIASDLTQLAHATSEEARYYKPISDESVLESTHKVALTVERPNFKDGKQWRFSDGGSSFVATMEDSMFQRKVDAGEAFRKGDIMECRVRYRQIRRGRAMRVERAILQVIEHHPRPDQSDFIIE